MTTGLSTSGSTARRGAGAIRAVIFAWLLAGTTDISVASVYFPPVGHLRVYPRFRPLWKNRVSSAVGFAIFVSCVMSFVVLPLSNVYYAPFNLLHFLISTVILKFTTGLPIATVVGKYYSRKES